MSSSVEPENKKMSKTCAAKRAVQLQTLAAAYFDRQTFQPGDLVTWKEGLKNCRWPKYGEPAIVMEVAEGQRDTEKEAVRPQFREPVEIRLGMFDGDGDFTCWWVDLNRLKLFTEADK